MSSAIDQQHLDQCFDESRLAGGPEGRSTIESHIWFDQNDVPWLNVMLHSPHGVESFAKHLIRSSSPTDANIRSLMDWLGHPEIVEPNWLQHRLAEQPGAVPERKRPLFWSQTQVTCCTEQTGSRSEAAEENTSLHRRLLVFGMLDRLLPG